MGRLSERGSVFTTQNPCLGIVSRCSNTFSTKPVWVRFLKFLMATRHTHLKARSLKLGRLPNSSAILGIFDGIGWFMFIVHGSWFLVHSSWFMVFGIPRGNQATWFSCNELSTMNYEQGCFHPYSRVSDAKRAFVDFLCERYGMCLLNVVFIVLSNIQKL